ncbi:hypothetical protein PsorP6_011837 [Peronosclerospora sorghi]|uniref:Uncharacterized protein n=1 Tax=Peronosclerospora sorghi TaxID=230839 RepID=A0ACC0WKH2_9STRA|nr:hypothetical protein PsorP6_011837 [Peronosclerospora sorghi]
MDNRPKATPQHNAAISSHSLSQHDAHVTWDEETIALHDLDRGTRMKIDEANTPYHYYAESGGVSPARSHSGKSPIEWEELQSKLQDVKDKKTCGWECSDDDEPMSPASREVHFAARDAEGKKIHKDPTFAQKRKSHYNEFERVRAWKMQHGNEEDDEEEEEHEEEKNRAA